MPKYGNAIIPPKQMAHFDAIIHGMPILVERVVDELESGMRSQIISVYEDIVLTTAYEDDTSATRNSSNAVVFRTDEYPPQEFDASKAIAEHWRPGSADPTRRRARCRAAFPARRPRPRPARRRCDTARRGWSTPTRSGSASGSAP